MPAIEARASPPASSSSATNGNRPKITRPSANTAEKHTFARGLRNTVAYRPGMPRISKRVTWSRAASRKRDDRGDQRERAAGREHEEHRAPAGEIADDAGERRAEQIAGDHGGEPAPDRDLALLHRDEIADHRDADREDAAARDAGDDARDQQRRVVGRERAEQRRAEQHREAHQHHADLADHVGDRPEHRLHQREGQRKRGGEQRHGFRIDAEFQRDRRHDRVDRARDQRGDEADQAQPEQDAPAAAVLLFRGEKFRDGHAGIEFGLEIHGSGIPIHDFEPVCCAVREWLTPQWRGAGIARCSW